MKKIWLLLIIGLLLSACVSSQTEAPPTLTPLPPKLTDTPLPPTETSVPPTQTPNPHAINALNLFGESINEGNYDKAEPLFSEEIQIATDFWVYEGLIGVEGLIAEFSAENEFSCAISDIEVNGNAVEFTWRHSRIDHSPPAPDKLVKFTCAGSATMDGEKIFYMRISCGSEGW